MAPVAIRSAAMATLTAGPARAIQSSCFGFSGTSIRATPPIGSKGMSWTSIP